MKTGFLVLACGLSSFAANAAVAQSWQPAAGRAEAFLPAASQGQVYGNPVLSCDGGAWLLSFATSVVPIGPNNEFASPARLVIDGAAFPTTVQPTGEGNEMPVPAAAIPALQAGSRLTLEFASGRSSFSASFSLRGSSRAIEHAHRLCASAGESASVTAAVEAELTAEEVRDLIAGKRIGWSSARRAYLPNGRYEGILDGRPDNGSYRVEPDGRLCWQGTVAGCFRFFRREGVLFARRDDSRSTAELGQVVVEATTTAAPAPPVLDEAIAGADLRAIVLGKPLRIVADDGSEFAVFFHPGEGFARFDALTSADSSDYADRFMEGGWYNLDDPARLCWETTSGDAGCFAFVRQAGQIVVRRDDAEASEVVGRLLVADAPAAAEPSGPTPGLDETFAAAGRLDGSGPGETPLRLNSFRDASALTLSGAAQVDSSGVLTLTPATGWTAGSVFSTRMIATRTFSTFFAFRISEPGNGGADGISFIAQTVSASLGDVGGGMGYAGVPNSLAIEFDTWHNGWDADDNHTGLLINGDVEHRDFPAVALAQPLEDGRLWFAWVDYDGAELSLRLSRERRRPEWPVLAHRLDVPALLGSDAAFVGFASATGAAHARHEILEWTYLERYAPEDISESQEIAAELQERRTIDLDIEFEFNSDRLTADGSQRIARFAEAARLLSETPPALSILGHTDAVGSADYNQRLSERRASTVREELIRLHGFPADRLLAQGLGESALKFPLAPEADGNRRVEIRLVD